MRPLILCPKDDLLIQVCVCVCVCVCDMPTGMFRGLQSQSRSPCLRHDKSNTITVSSTTAIAYFPGALEFS